MWIKNTVQSVSATNQTHSRILLFYSTAGLIFNRLEIIFLSCCKYQWQFFIYFSIKSFWCLKIYIDLLAFTELNAEIGEKRSFCKFGTLRIYACKKHIWYIYHNSKNKVLRLKESANYGALCLVGFYFATLIDKHCLLICIRKFLRILK